MRADLDHPARAQVLGWPRPHQLRAVEVMVATLMQMLCRLQAADQEWDAKLRQFQAIKHQLADHSGLESRRGEQSHLVDRCTATRGQLRDAELELSSLTQRAREADRELYGGRGRSPRELGELERDLEHLRQRIAQLEDRVLAQMAESEDLEAAVQRGEDALRQYEAQWRAERDAFTAQYEALRARLQELQSLREELKGPLPRSELALYEELRGKKAGVALAVVRDGICHLCRVTVPSLKAHVLAKGEKVALCDGCGRILCEG